MKITVPEWWLGGGYLPPRWVRAVTVAQTNSISTKGSQMNGNKSSAAQKRNYRTIKVAPTTRAIRAALALSATMLALSGSGAAFAAGTCTIGDDPVVCNGTFGDDVYNYVDA